MAIAAMAEGSAGKHPLAAAAGIWQSAKAEMKDNEELKDGVLVPPEELKKVAKWLHQTVTKFGASASVADGATDKALISIGEEVIKAFTAATQTLVCLSRGAGASLLAEIRENGSTLAATVEELGASVGTSSLAVSAGKVLDRVQHLTRMSAHNRASIRRRLLRSLSQVSDAGRELQQALHGADNGGCDLDEDDDLGGSDDAEFEPGERQLVEAVASAIEVLLEVLKEASRLCVPGSTSPTSASASAAAAAVAEVPIDVLEACAQHADSAAQAVDGLAVHAVGGLDIDAFKASLSDLRTAANGFDGWPTTTNQLPVALDQVQAAMEAVPSD